jgi:hypothetical protein
MSDTQITLPDGFSSLLPFARIWAQANTADDRHKLRLTLPMAELRALYDAGAPMIEKIFAHLDAFGIDAPLPPAEQALYRTALGIGEAGAEFEIFGGQFNPLALKAGDPWTVHFGWCPSAPRGAAA